MDLMSTGAPVRCSVIFFYVWVLTTRRSCVCDHSFIGIWVSQKTHEVNVSFFGLVLIYKYRDALFRWSPGKNPTHTVHIDDVAGGMWACAQWMAPLGRKEANSLAGEAILFHNDKSKASEVEGMPAPDKKLIAPLFNLVRKQPSSPEKKMRSYIHRSMTRTAPCSALDRPLRRSLALPLSFSIWWRALFSR